jgi:hypothetical protein
MVRRDNTALSNTLCGFRQAIQSVRVVSQSQIAGLYRVVAGLYQSMGEVFSPQVPMTSVNQCNWLYYGKKTWAMIFASNR